MVYVMVTQWDGHWDKIPHNRTLFTVSMMRGQMSKEKIPWECVDGVQSIFLKKIKGQSRIEKCWRGKAYNFANGDYKGKPAVHFNVKIDEEIVCPESYIGYTEGWYLEEDMPKCGETASELDPKFFDMMRITNDWIQFEKYGVLLLKLLGIHEIYTFPQDDQRGKADGFLKFENLAILFDFTLEANYETAKKIQIDNYIEQLRKGSIEIENQTITFKDSIKHVWIITRQGTLRAIKTIDRIAVKEITIDTLIRLYRRRLIENLTFDALRRALEDLV